MGERVASDADFDGTGLRIGICCGRFNRHITDRLLEGARRGLADHGVAEADTIVVWAPGAYELPLVAQHLFDAQMLLWQGFDLAYGYLAVTGLIPPDDLLLTSPLYKQFLAVPVRLAWPVNVPVPAVPNLGGHDAWPLGQALPRPGRLSIVYHPVIAPPDATDSRAAARSLARQVRDAIASRLPPAQQPAADL